MKILIFGNSGSGKSTLALDISANQNIGHLDLDTIAWLPVSPPERTPIVEAEAQIKEFTDKHSEWVIEGCYTDLLELTSEIASEIIFLNLPVGLCIENAKNRPWEPHKYASKELQDQNLAMLINWISDYALRDDTFSRKAHTQFFDDFVGKKTMYVSNARDV